MVKPINLSSFIFACFVATINLSSCNGHGSSSAQTPMPLENIADISSSINVTLVKNGTVYIGTAAGNVWKKDSNSKFWKLVGYTRPDGSPIKSIAIDQQNNVYAKTASGFIWVAYHGNQWSTSTVIPNVDSADMGSPIVNDNNGNIYYAGPLSTNVYAPRQLGLWKIVNNNWEQVGVINPDGQATSIAIGNDNNIYVGTNKGAVWKYANAKWDEVCNANAGNTITAITIDNNNNVYASTSKTLQKCSKNSSQWQSLGVINATVNSLNVDKNGNLCAGTQNGLTCSINNRLNIFDAVIYLNLNGAAAVRSTAVDEYDNFYFGTSNGHVLTQSAAQLGWINIGSPIWGVSSSNYIQSLAVDYNNNILYVGTEGGGVFMCTYSMVSGASSSLSQCQATSLLNASLTNGNIFALAVDGVGILYAGTSQGNVLYYNSQLSQWNILTGSAPDGSTVNTLTVDYTGKVIVGTDAGYLYQCDNGMTCNYFNQSTSVDPDINSLAVGIDGDIYFGSSAGMAWKYLRTGDPKTDGRFYLKTLDSAINSVIAEDQVGSEFYGNIYMGTQGANNNGGYLWIYNTPSRKWSMLGTPDGSAINQLVLDTKSNVYAATANGNIMIARLKTSVWLGLGTPDGSSINAIAIDGNRNIYAGTNNGNLLEYQWYLSQLR